MQKSFLQKAEHYLGPCGANEGCADDGYDPCGSTDDITDKDFAVILKEEAGKAQKTKDVEGLTEAGKLVDATLSDGKKEKGGEPKKEEETSGKGRATNRTSQESEEREERSGEKKRTCKKFIKNPFFTNRLKFSTDLPPPPPAPPPQYLPLVEETDSSGRIPCSKRRRKCRKKNEGDDGKGKRGRNDKHGKDGEDDKDGRDGQFGEYGKDGRGSEGDEGEEEECVGSCEDADGRGGRGRGGSEDERRRRGSEDGRGKKKCVRKADLPPCKKRVSEVSISLQPPQLPPQQRGLPPTCPMELPEVKRQMLMACAGRKIHKICMKKKKRES